MGGQTLGLHIVGCRGRLATKVEIVEMSLKLPLSLLNSSVIWRAKPKIRNARYAKANGALQKEKPTQNENTRKCRTSKKHNKSETSTHSHREDKNERGCE